MVVTTGYKSTAVGVIPSDWEIFPLSALLEFRNGVNADKKAYGKGIPFINVLEVITKGHLRASDIPGRVLLSQREVDSYAVKCGDIVFNRTSETQQEVGLAAVYVDDQAAVFGGFVIRGRPISDDLDPVYSGYAFRSAVIRTQIISRGQGAIRANIGQGDLRQLLTIVPKLVEQRAIGKALSDVDALISSLEQLIAKKRDFRQGAMQELLTGRKRLPGFSGEWDVLSFPEVFTKINAKSHQVQTFEYQTTGSFPIVDQGKASVVGFSDRVDKCFRCPQGGVVVFGDHTCIAKFVDFDFVVGADGTQILAAKEGHDARFHAFQLQLHGIVSTGYNRHFRFLKERQFVSPHFREQLAIAEVLSDMDSEVAVLQRRRDKTHAIKQAMIQELLTGRTRLI